MEIYNRTQPQQYNGGTKEVDECLLLPKVSTNRNNSCHSTPPRDMTALHVNHQNLGTVQSQQDVELLTVASRSPTATILCRPRESATRQTPAKHLLADYTSPPIPEQDSTDLIVCIASTEKHREAEVGIPSTLSRDQKLDSGEDAYENSEGPPTRCPAFRFFMKGIDPLFGMVFKWSLAILLLLFLSSIVFGILYSGIHYHGSAPTDACQAPYGTMLGVHNGVIAYSNCNSETISDDNAYVPFHSALQKRVADHQPGNGAGKTVDLYTGLQWQCVEYARRYWMVAGKPESAFFGPVNNAYDIWDLRIVTTVQSALSRLTGSAEAKTYTLQRYLNGQRLYDGGKAPAVGDLLIYPRQAGGFPNGHVAVIVEVTSSEVLVAEQNWDNSVWRGAFKNYSRAIPMVYDAQGLSYVLKDPDGTILGWMRYG